MRRGAAAAGLLGLAWACALGCTSAPPRGAPTGEEGAPVVHVVEPGDTIYRLSQRYGVPVADIVSANGITDVSALEVGTQLVIPGAKRRASVGPATRIPPFGGDLRARAYREAQLEFEWPIHGGFSSGFGWRGLGTHDGIDLTASPGTLVHAAEAGRITYAGWMGDYGRVVMIKHARGYSSVYAHNRVLRVEKGQFVEKGDVLAEVGATGNASGPHLHFEIRREKRAEDPLRYLPAYPATATVASPAPDR
jgi:murein DD-endopeptidase MepM/ murein hydrolase activator NlpD